MLNFKICFIYVALLAEIISLASGATIECSFSGDINKYYCIANIVDPITAENEAITVTGTHVDGFSGNDVTTLGFEFNDAINFYPTKISDSFPNLKSIGIDSNFLTTLTSNAFTKCSKLNSISIIENNFRTIPASFAESCTELTQLDFIQNQIVSIHKDAFKGLANIKYLMLHFNNINYIEPGTFQPMKSLSDITLYANKISEIHPDTFVGLPNLTYIQLDHNSIKILPAFNLVGTQNLKFFGLDFNSITAIQSTFSDSYPTSGFLNWWLKLTANECIDDEFNTQKPMTVQNSANLSICYDNYNILVPTTSLPSTTTTTMPPTTTTTTMPPITTPGLESESSSCAEHKDCRYFLDQNRKYTCVLENVDLLLTSIGGDHVSGFTDSDVKKVYVVDSTLSKVPRVIFDKFDSVEFLSIRNTSLTILNENTFEVCGVNLSVLDASNNQIREVTENALILCQNLETLDLTNCPVEEFKSGIYEADKNLKHVIMSRVIPVLP